MDSTKALKYLVIGMGLILVFGTIALFAGIAIKYGNTQETQASRCNDAPLALPEGSEILGMDKEGDALHLIVRTDTGTRLFTADLCSGAIKPDRVLTHRQTLP